MPKWTPDEIEILKAVMNNKEIEKATGITLNAIKAKRKKYL